MKGSDCFILSPNLTPSPLQIQPSFSDILPNSDLSRKGVLSSGAREGNTFHIGGGKFLIPLAEPPSCVTEEGRTGVVVDDL